jgi:hypothetical protein
MHFDMPLGEQFGRGNQMRPRRVGFDPERNDVRVFDEEQQVGDAIGTALFNQAALQVARG